MILEVHPENPNSREMGMVEDALRNDGVVIYPTDTVYAFGWDISSPKAYDRIMQIKGKKSKQTNFSIICKDISMVSEFTLPIGNQIFKLMKRNLPGPFTFILPANNNVPRYYKHKKKTIGIRIPDNLIAQDIVERLNRPIMTTSIHDDEDEIMDYLTDPTMMDERYGHLVDYIIDGGFGDIEPSTVLDCTGNEISVIREGKGELI